MNMAALQALKKLDGIDVQSLSPLHRILLITDGTLTEILEAHFLEHVQLIKLSQHVVTATASHAQFEPDEKEKFLERKVLLRGSNSGNTYVYAESMIAMERLNPRLYDQLLNSNTPLGRLWLEHKLETFKELTEIKCQPANDLSQHFGCAASSPLLSRTYRVVTNAKPVMIISEYFPAEIGA